MGRIKDIDAEMRELPDSEKKIQEALVGDYHIGDKGIFLSGRRKERERIIKLIEENTMTMTSPLDNSVMRSLRMSPSELIALIKKETDD